MRALLSERIGGIYFDQASEYKFAIIKELKRSAAKKHSNLLDFGVGEPDQMADEIVVRALQEECEKTENRFYADNGSFVFLRAVAEFMESFFKVKLDPGTEALHCLGIKSALSILPCCIINPGDYVIATSPGYDVFQTNAEYYGAKIYNLELKPQNNFLPNLGSIPKEILNKTKAIILNYPNNPTGARGSKAFFEEAVNFAKKHNVLLINDAAYSTLNFDNEPLSILQVDGAKEVAVELHSMSKAFNMTGWRIGWVCGNSTIVKAYGKVKNTMNSGQFLAIQKAAASALSKYKSIIPANIKKYKRRCESFIKVLEKNAFKVFCPAAGFFVYTEAPKYAVNKTNSGKFAFPKSLDFTKWLLDSEGIVTVPWEDKDNEYVRFSMTFETNEKQNEKEVIKLLNQRLSNYNFLY